MPCGPRNRMKMPFVVRAAARFKVMSTRSRLAFSKRVFPDSVQPLSLGTEPRPTSEERTSPMIRKDRNARIVSIVLQMCETADTCC